MIPQKRARSPPAKAGNPDQRALKAFRWDSADQYLSLPEIPSQTCIWPAPEPMDVVVSHEPTSDSPSLDLMDMIVPGSAPRRTGVLDLPDDVMTRIFESFQPAPELCRLMEVCKRFAGAAATPQLWRHVKAVDPATRRLREAEVNDVYKTIDYGSRTASADNAGSRLARKRSTSTSGLRAQSVGFAVDVITSRAGSHLASLDLEECYPDYPPAEIQMSNAELATISVRCSTSLQKLRLSPSSFITGPGLVSFANACPKLRILHMTGCVKITDNNLGDIIRVCPTLEDISVSRCSRFQGTGIHTKLRPIRNTLKRIDVSVTEARNLYLAGFMGGYPALEAIKADGCQFLEEADRDPPPSATLSFPSLVSLNLDKISLIPKAWLKLVLVKSSKLRFLSLNMTHQRIRGIREVFEVDWPPLKYLGLSGQRITDTMWQSIYEKLGASLVQCDLSRNKHLTGIIAVGEESFAVLEDLNLRATGFTTESARALMVYIAPKLKFLDLSGCRGVERLLRRNPLSFREPISVTAQSYSHTLMSVNIMNTSRHE